MWGSPIHLEDRNLQLILLDFEGISASGSHSPLDCKLFSLAVLLSSMLCFNSKNKLEDQTFEEMALAADLDRYIKIRAPTMFSTDQTPGGGPRSTLDNAFSTRNLLP